MAASTSAAAEAEAKAAEKDCEDGDEKEESSLLAFSPLSTMDFKNAVFTAARDGKLRRLKLLLDHRVKEEVLKLATSKTNGTTPLVVAARNGHMDVSRYLLEQCSVDIEQVGCVTFDGETIEGAPPLWSAAAAGHYDLVKLLVECGANVNSRTKTNSTPLRAACYDGHFDIVRFLTVNNADVEVANRHGHTCLMIACFKNHYKIAKYLVELGADVNRKSVKGNTALHDCAESGSLEILKLLLLHGAKMDVDSYGMTPLLAASITGQSSIVEYLISVPSCTREEHIDALELLGATYVDKKRDILGALKLWKRAMELRLLGNIIHKPSSLSLVAAYEHAVEVTTLEQLDELILNPDEMKVQALLVRERILGPAHPDTSYYIRYRGALYADTGNFDRCITLWMYALEMQQKILEPLNPMTQSSLLSFAELFSFMMCETRHCWRTIPNVSFNDLMVVFLKAVEEVQVGRLHMNRIPVADRDSTCFNRLLVITMHLICLLCRLQPFLSDAENHVLHKAVYEFVHLDPRGRNGWTPLHLACARDSSSIGRYPICTFPSLEVVDLLLDVGADPCATDYDHNTPLHIAATNRPCKQSIIQALLKRGSHFDRCNLDKKTFVDLLGSLSVHDIVSPVQFTSLQCLAAQTVMKWNLPYKGNIPVRLESFVEVH